MRAGVVVGWRRCHRWLWAGVIAASLALAGVGAARPALAGAPGAVEISYLMWDAGQVPAYRQCATDFARLHPGTTVKIRQMGWNDYWMKISTGFIAGLAPDVFVNHLGHYPQFATNGLLLDLAPLIARDRVDTRIYESGLLEAWQRAGRQYGMPKDWDAVALMVNMTHARQAGVSLAELQAMRWNPQDGGSFEQVLRRLTTDAQGRSAASAGFDRRAVRMYGFQTAGSGGMAGQTEWSHLAVSNGFRFQDQPWSAPFHYGDPRLAETIDWLAGLPGKGLSAPLESSKALGPVAMFVSGKVAMVPEGSWMIGFFAANAKFDTAWVTMPVGPTGQRASMVNGLADSIWSGTPHPQQAWQWVRYLASPACQNAVARHAVLFPAVKGLAQQVLALHQAKGTDVSAFLTMAQSKTFGSPVSERGAEIDELMKGAIESVLLGREPAGPALQRAHAQVNRLLAPAAQSR